MFKSFYKIQHSLIHSDMGLSNTARASYTSNNMEALNNTWRNNRTTANIITTNLLITFITLFSLRYSNISKRTAASSSIVNYPSNLLFKVSFFFLPKRKKNVIFLRAPYKNKLARLNILNLEYTLILSIRTYPTIAISQTSLVALLTYFSAFNLSSAKLKHVKTTVSTNSLQPSNFELRSFVA